NDTFYDEAGPGVMDAGWRPIAKAGMSPPFGPPIDTLDGGRGLDGLEGEAYVGKDLRTPLRGPAEGPFGPSSCGLGSLKPGADSLWQAIHQAADGLALAQGQPEPGLWRKTASKTGFVPGLLPNKFPTTNRPTFQQVLEFDRQGD